MSNQPSIFLTKENHFVLNIASLILFASQKLSLQISFGEAFRTKEQQAIYFKSGLSRTMKSQHLDRLAIDLNFFKNGNLLTKKEEFKELAEYWKSLDIANDCGYFWGWDFNHFQTL